MGGCSFGILRPDAFTDTGRSVSKRSDRFAQDDKNLGTAFGVICLSRKRENQGEDSGGEYGVEEGGGGDAGASAAEGVGREALA
jgi:hypothetical protein